MHGVILHFVQETVIVIVASFCVLPIRKENYSIVYVRELQTHEKINQGTLVICKYFWKVVVYIFKDKFRDNISVYAMECYSWKYSMKLFIPKSNQV